MRPRAEAAAAARVAPLAAPPTCARRRRAAPAILLAALALAGAASAPGAEATEEARTAPREFFGVNGPYLRAFVDPAQAPILDGLAASMASQRIAWARVLFDQAVDERRRGRFNWYAGDAMVAALARHGVRAEGLLFGTAAWASDPATLGESCGARARPYDVAGWAEWAGAAAARYGSGGSFWDEHPELPRLPVRRWEIGNEVNTAVFWCPVPSPEQYAAVYSASAAAIGAADPAAEAIVGGLARWPVVGPPEHLGPRPFLRRMTAADPSLRESIPAVAIHPYGRTPEAVVVAVTRFREAMTAAGMRRTPMLANELGWHTQGAGPTRASEQRRARMMAAVTDRLWRLDCGLEGVAPYSWITMQRDPADREDWFGLTDASTGAPLPSGLAYGRQIRIATAGRGKRPSRATIRACSPAVRARSGRARRR